MAGAMTGDDDIDHNASSALPPHPPPAPARREAAIAEAMRRFDSGVVEAPFVPPRRSLRTRPQLAGLVAASLVLVVGVPVAWLALSRGASPPVETGNGAAADLSAILPDQVQPTGSLLSTPPPSMPPPLTPPPPTARAGALPADSARLATVPGVALRANVPAVPPRVAAPAPAAAPVAASAVAEAEAPPAQLALREGRRAVVSGASGNMARAVPPPPPLPPPAPLKAASPAMTRGMSIARRPNADAGVAPGYAGRADAADSANVIVTAQRVKRRGADSGKARVGWSACTVDDPRRSLAACRAEADKEASAEGLALAWRGDDRGAIAAFDRAIASNSKASSAWLNRGLARGRAGDNAGALADLERAAKLAPGSARAHHALGRLLRARGDTRRAQAEFDRAAQLDPAFGEPDD